MSKKVDINNSFSYHTDDRVGRASLSVNSGVRLEGYSLHEAQNRACYFIGRSSYEERPFCCQPKNC